MSMRQAWRLNVAVIAVMTLALLGGWETYQGITQGTPLAWAVDVDDDLDKDKDKEDFDHFACYEVYPYHQDKDTFEDDKDRDKDVVTIFNQFTKDKDGKFEKQWVKVGRLKLLCVPTHKEHKDMQ
jgi:hypothetical protein